MKAKMLNLLWVVSLCVVMSVVGGCASTSNSTTQQASQDSSKSKKKKQKQENVTSMPWNTPPSWQQNGQAGSYMGGMPGAGF
ncbi:hypothetical protein [Methylacidiphilum sp. Yel]|uniref:hypothetical protein n=1 Tax=Methylacidiphilum sp. Yel TaxID=1847730 RepID=UPI00106C0300|nr:hypothetical protein [Methylacidiphilum sp. Yel]